MTKASELAVLDEAIAQLGPHSYLGPWLKSVRAEVDANIRSDFAPTMLPSEARARAKDIEQAAKDRAQEIIDQAEKTATARRKETDDYCTRTVLTLRRTLEKAVADLGGRPAL